MAPRKGSKRARRRTSIDFNHVILYVGNVSRAREFYEKLLGFQLIEAYDGYARLRSSKGNSTLALHQIPNRTRTRRGQTVVLYFETRDLEPLYRRLRAARVRIDQPPRRMPWGWTHAYLRDPDGHPLSLYWAGRKRFGRTSG
jgi:catechol 2,3-dioxygenase-like lactoylglutathione lyase family enzyme